MKKLFTEHGLVIVAALVISVLLLMISPLGAKISDSIFGYSNSLDGTVVNSIEGIEIPGGVQGMEKKLLWEGSTTGTINLEDLSEYDLIGITISYNGAAQECIVVNRGGWQTIGTNYQGHADKGALVAKAIYVNGSSISQGTGFWVRNGNSLNVPATAVYGYK